MKDSLKHSDSEKHPDSKNEVQSLIIVILITVYDEEATFGILKKLMIEKGEENGY